MRITKSSSAFTLVELLVAVALLAIITTAIASVVGISRRAQLNVASSIECSVTMRETVNLVQEDINGLIVQSAGDVSSIKGRMDSSRELHLRLWTCPEIGCSSSSRLIDYFLVPENENSALLMLIRRVREVKVQDIIDTLSTAEKSNAEDNISYEILVRGITAGSLRFFDDGIWRDNYDSAQAHEHPALVELSLTFEYGRSGGSTMVYAFSVPQWAVMPPDAVGGIR